MTVLLVGAAVLAAAVVALRWLANRAFAGDIDPVIDLGEAEDLRPELRVIHGGQS